MKRFAFGALVIVAGLVVVVTESLGNGFLWMQPGTATVTPSVLTDDDGDGDAPSAVQDGWRQEMTFELDGELMDGHFDGVPDAIGTPLFVRAGILTTKFKTVGLLLTVDSSGAVKSWCTGTLIDPETFVTAAHCVEDRSLEYRVYLQNVGVVEALSGGITSYCEEKPC